MNAYAIRSKTLFGTGELFTCVKLRNSDDLLAIPVVEDDPHMVYFSNTHVLELYKPNDIGLLARALKLELSTEIGDSVSVAAFCQVLASSFIHWTADVCANEFLEDLRRSPDLHRIGFDSNEVQNPICTDGGLQFYVWSEHGGKGTILKVRFDLRTFSLATDCLVTWNLRQMKYIEVED